MANDTWFPEPEIGDTESLFSFFRFINNAVEGLFFPVILLVIWLITFVSMLFTGSFSRPAAAKGWIFASFFTTILSIPLATLDLIASKYMYISIVFLGIGVLWLIIEGGE